MPLIKSAIATTTVRLSLRDIETDARQRVAAARDEAERLLADARERAGEIGANAMQQGWAQGYQQGTEEASREATERFAGEMALAVEALARAAAAMEASRVELETAALTDVVKLAIGIARRVTKRQGVIDPAVLTENLREAVKQLIRRDDVRVAIHPAQREALASAVAQLKIDWPQLEHVEVVEDDSIAPGGCRVSGGQGEIDADLQTQLDRIAADLIPHGDQHKGNGNT
jgi:flagellar assembly protein FliH